MDSTKLFLILLVTALLFTLTLCIISHDEPNTEASSERIIVSSLEG